MTGRARSEQTGTDKARTDKAGTDKAGAQEVGAREAVTAGGVSIHAVDVASGRPAEGLHVRLLREADAGADGPPDLLAEGRCGPTGLFDHPTVRGDGITAGRYVAEFAIGDFYAARDGAAAGFLETAVFRFAVTEIRQHYHLPLKFTAWGYSLFRGGL